MLGWLVLMLALTCVIHFVLCLQRWASLKINNPSCFIFEDAVLLNDRLLDGLYCKGPQEFTLLEDKTQYPDAPLLKVSYGRGPFGNSMVLLPNDEEATLEQARSVIQSFETGYRPIILNRDA